MPKAEGEYVAVSQRYARPPLPSFLCPSRHSCAGRNPGDRPTLATAQDWRRPSRHSPTRRRTFEAKHSHRSPGFLPAQSLPLT